MLKPLSELLGVTINELLSGELIKEHSQEKFEENIMHTIDYTNKKIMDKNKMNDTTFVKEVFESLFVSNYNN